MTADVPRQPLRNKVLGNYFDFRFQRLLVTQALDTAGSAFVAIALAGSLFFSVPTAQARGKVLLYLVFTVVPFAIVSAVLGGLLDRGMGYRRAAVVVAAFGRAVVAWLMSTRTDSFLLFPLALGILVGQRFYAISRASLVPACLPPEEHLIDANAFMVRTGALAGFAAALLGAATHKLFGADAVLRVAAVAYLIMGAAGLLLPSPGRRRGGQARRGGPPEPIDPSHAVTLRPGFRAIAGMRALNGFLLFLLAFALRSEKSGAAGFGILLLGIGLGALASSLAAPVLNRYVREDIVIFAAFFGSGIATMLAARLYALPTAAVVAALVGAGFSMSKLAFDAMAQRGLPRNVQGRLFARWETAFQLCWVSGSLLPVAVRLPTRAALVVAGLATVVGSIVYAVDVSRTRHREAFAEKVKAR